MNTIETPEGTIVTEVDRLEPVKSLAEEAGAKAINLANKAKMLKLFEKKMRKRMEKPRRRDVVKMQKEFKRTVA